MLGLFSRWLDKIGRARPWSPRWMAWWLLFAGPIYCCASLWTYSEFPGGQDHVPSRLAIGIIPPLYYIFRRLLRFSDRLDAPVYTLLLWGISFHNLYLSVSNGLTPFHLCDYLGMMLITMAATLGPIHALLLGTVNGALFAIAVVHLGELSSTVLSGALLNLAMECLLMALVHHQRIKALEKVEAESAETEKLMISSLHEGLVLQDATGAMVYANAQALSILGEEGFTARALREDGEPLPASEQPANVTLRTGSPVRDFVMGIDCPDGLRRWLRVNTTPISLHQLRKRGASSQGVIALFDDITQAREMEHIMRMREAQMSEGARLSSLGELAAGVGHEINNPLAAMKLRLEMLGGEWQALPEERKPPKFQEEFPRILKSVDRIERIVLSLRNLSRDAIADQPAECFVTDVVQDAVEVFSAKLVNAGITLQLEIDPQSVIHARGGQISQVILNLVQNSLDAIVAQKEKRPSPWIKVRQSKRMGTNGDEIVVSVEDSGPGIAEDIRNKLARPFFTTKPPGKGTGLGLSISRNIMEQHGGTLSPRFDMGHTCFELRFPVPVKVRSASIKAV